jgi:hypothetical protein
LISTSTFASASCDNANCGQGDGETVAETDQVAE